jgi:hypothetical protein
MRIALRLLMAVCWALLAAEAASAQGTAQSEKRAALVIGNSAYKHTPALANPKNDMADMAEALRKLGFSVLEGRDLDKGAMDRKLRDFAQALSGAQVGLFFYAGHGLQVGGQNYLVPVDAELATASAIDFELVRLDLVQRTMERQTSTNILMPRQSPGAQSRPCARNTLVPDRAGLCAGRVGRGHIDRVLDPAGQCGTGRHRAKLALCGCPAEAHSDPRRRPAEHPDQCAQ